MRRYKKFDIKDFLKSLRENYLPTSRDNLKQITIKAVFILLIIAIAVSGIYFGSYYGHSRKQQRLLDQCYEIFSSNDSHESYKLLSQQNSDYQGWIQFGDTKLNNPVYKAKDNSFYLNRNSNRKQSDFGSVFMDYRFNNGDKNVVIYGNTLKNGLMFSVLDNLRTLNFYKQNSLISFTDAESMVQFKIYAVFVLNAKIEDDGGHIYNIYRKSFTDETDFGYWVAEAKSRSIINTGVEVNIEDKILTLVTSCEDFENARLVVMARSQREEEELTANAPTARVNENPIYPKKWYSVRNIEYPF